MPRASIGHRPWLQCLSADAAHAAAVGPRAQIHRAALAARLGKFAARREVAAGRQPVQGRRRAGDGRQPLVRPPQLRRAGQQRAGVGMQRTRKQRRRIRRLHYAAGIHHQDAVAQARHHPQVVADEQQRRALFPAQGVHEPQDLRLHGHVERGGGLVGDDQRRIKGQRHGDHHPLAHAAGELVGIGMHALLRLVDAYPGQQLDRAPARRAALHGSVRAQGLDQLRAHGAHGIQGGERILGNVGDARAAQRAPAPGRSAQQVLAVEPDAASHKARRRREAHERQGRHRLAAAGFAHHAEALAGPQGKAHLIHGPQGVAEAHRKALDAQQGVVRAGRRRLWRRQRRWAQRRPAAAARIEQIPQSVAGQVDAHHQQQDGHAGSIATRGTVVRNSRPLPSMLPRSAAGGCAPRPRKLRPAVSRIIQPRLVEARITTTGSTFGQQLAEQDARRPRAGEPRRVHERTCGQLHHCAAHGAGEEGHVRHRHGDHGIGQAGTQGCDDGERQQQVGEGEQHVDGAHRERVDPAAPVDGHQADQGAGQGRRGHGDGAHRQAGAGAPYQARQQVAAQLVGAQQMPGTAGRQQPPGQIHGVGIGQRQQRRTQRQGHQHRHQRQAGQRQAVAGRPIHDTRILGSRTCCTTSSARFTST